MTQEKSKEYKFVQKLLPVQNILIKSLLGYNLFLRDFINLFKFIKK